MFHGLAAAFFFTVIQFSFQIPTCPVCDEVILLNLNAYHEHMHRAHGGARPSYVCKYCGTEFESSSAYYTHMRTHKSLLSCPLLSPTGDPCERTFHWNMHLLTHMTNVHNLDINEATKILGLSLRKPLEQYSSFVEKSCPSRCLSKFDRRSKMIANHLAGTLTSTSQGLQKATCHSHFMKKEELTDKWFKDNNIPPENVKGRGTSGSNWSPSVRCSLLVNL